MKFFLGKIAAGARAASAAALIAARASGYR
jgi:hypothetical protein